MSNKGRPKKDSELVTFSVRLADEQTSIHKSLKLIEEDTGRSFADVVRAILQIGIESFKAGSNVGFDGKVILAFEKSRNVIDNKESDCSTHNSFEIQKQISKFTS